MVSSEETVPESPKKAASKAKKSAPKVVAEAAEAVSFPYAIFVDGGKQYRVSRGDMVLLETREADVGAALEAKEVLFLARAPGDFVVGKPQVSGAKVTLEVLQRTLGKKILIRHHRRRQNSQKTLGHRQPYIRVVVKDIQF